jgi:hypothetical protein
MPAPMTVLATVTAIKPTVDSLTRLVNGINELGGKHQVGQLQQELAESMGELRTALQAIEDDLVKFGNAHTELRRTVESLSAEVAYLRLPFWKRWFTPAPTRRV